MNNKIVILANDSGGVYGFRKELIQRLLNDDKDIILITPFTRRIEELRSMGCELIEVKMNRRGINPFEDIKLLIEYYRLLRKKHPQTVITYTIKPNIYGSMICEFLNIPYVVNITGLGSSFEKDNFIKKLVIFLYKFALKKAKTVFFENEGNRQIFIDNKIIQESKTHLLMGAGVNLDIYQYEKYPKNDVIKFLFIGRVMKEKGIDELFQAFEKLIADKECVSLEIVGEFEENYESKIEEYEKAGWLHYHGFQTDVKPYIKDSNCFVLPSWHEGMSNANLECASMGRPIITSNIYGCKEAVIDNISGYLVEKKDVEALYYAMKKFLKLSNAEREKMGRFGRNHMEKCFDKNLVVEETVNELLE